MCHAQGRWHRWLENRQRKIFLHLGGSPLTWSKISMLLPTFIVTVSRDLWLGQASCFQGNH